MPALVPNSATATSKLMENYRLGSPVEPGNEIETFTDQDGNVNVITVAEGDVHLFTPSKVEGAGWKQIDFLGTGSSISAAGGLLQGKSIVFSRTKRNRLYYWLQNTDGKWGPALTISAAISETGKITATSIAGSVYLTIFETPTEGYNNYTILEFSNLPNAAGILSSTTAFSGLINSDSVQILNLSGDVVEIYLTTPKIVEFQADSFVKTWSNQGMNNIASGPGPQSSSSKYVGQISFWYPKCSSNVNAYPMGDIGSQSFSPPASGTVYAEIRSDRSSDAAILEPVQSWNKMWDDHGTDSITDGALYSPFGPGGYQGMGMAATMDSDGNAESYSAPPPPTSTYWSVADSKVTSFSGSDVSYLWRDQHSKAKDGKIELFTVTPKNDTDVFSDGSFVGDTSGYTTSPPSTLYGQSPNRTGYSSHISTVPAGDASPNQTVDAGTDMELMTFSTRSDGSIIAFGSYGGGISCLDGLGAEWQALFRNPTPGGDTLQFTKLQSEVGASGLAECFLLDSSGTLFVITETPDGAEAPFTDLFPIADGIDTFSVGVSGEGLVQVYAVTVTGKLESIFQSTDTGAWTTRLVNFNSGKLQNVSSYTTQFTFTNQQGTPLISREVSLLADAPMGLNVNGQTCAVNQKNPITIRTNAMGELNCIALCGNLSTIPLTAWGPDMDEEEACRIDPTTGVQTYFTQVTGDDIGNATNAAGNNVFDLSSTDNGEVAQGLQAMMGSIADGPSERSSDAAWSLDLTGPLRFRELSSTEADERLAQMRDVSLPSLHIDFGAIYTSIKHGVAELAELGNILYTGAKYAVQYIIDGVTYLWEGVMEEAREIMEMVSALFDWAKAKAEDVFEWLAFLFHWDDILNTQKVIDALLKMSLQALPAFIHDAGVWVDENITRLEGEADDFFEELAAKIAPELDHNQTVASGFQRLPSNPQPDACAGTNIVNSSIMNGATEPNAYGVRLMASPTSGETLTFTDEQFAMVNSIVDQMKAAVGDYQGSDGFEKAINDFAQIAAQPEDFVNLALQGILEIIKAILIDAMEAGRVILGILFQAIETVAEMLVDFLVTEWEIPLVSELYESIAGVPLSISGAASFAMAIPTTVGYKAAFKNAPFTDEQVQQIVAIVDADPSPNAESNVQDSLAEKCEQIKAVIGEYYPYFYTVLNTGCSLVNVGLDTTTNLFDFGKSFGLKDSKLGGTISAMALTSEWINSGVMNLPCLKPTPTNRWDWGFYLGGLVVPVCDSVWFFSEKKGKEKAKEYLEYAIEEGELQPLLGEKKLSKVKRIKACLIKNAGEWGPITIFALGLFHFGVNCVVIWRKLENSEVSEKELIWIDGGAQLVDSTNEMLKLLAEEEFLPKAIVAVLALAGVEGVTPKAAHGGALAVLCLGSGVAGVASTALDGWAAYEEFPDDMNSGRPRSATPSSIQEN